MNRVLIKTVLVTWMLGVSAMVFAQNDNMPASDDKTAPSYDMKAQSLLDLERVNKKFVDLENAIPSDKFTWRPSADSRSFAEVFLHVAGERYQILKLMGATPSSDFNGKTFEKSTTDKAQIAEQLTKSWEWAQKQINGMTNADFAKLLPKLGPQANAGDVVYILVADAHEHLGQVIAYARVNGIVPPWTVEAQKQAAAKKAAEKKPEQK
ncbi:MAG TPA: DinB family protein [Terriglobales bacterium]|nr:DinB family protein [Terriglobales bacterium]